MSKAPTGPARKDWWTWERRQRAREWWTPERRAFLSAQRKEKPQGMYASAWWTAERRASQQARLVKAHWGAIDRLIETEGLRRFGQ